MGHYHPHEPQATELMLQDNRPPVVTSTERSSQVLFSQVRKRFYLASVLALLLISFVSSPSSAQSIGSEFTVQYVPYGGLVDFGSSAVGRGFCIDYDRTAPGSGWSYTVVDGSNTGLSSSTRNKVAAALQALSDGFSERDVSRAIWHFTDNKQYYGDPVTIINRVNNGTYQPQPVVWFLPESGHLQPMVSLLTNPPTPTPTPAPTQTPTPTPQFGNVCTTEIVSVHSNKCLDVNYSSHDNGANIIQWFCGGSNNQQFSIEQSGSDPSVFNIRAKHSGKAVDVDSGSTTNGTNIQQWAHDPNSANQRFRLEPVAGQSNTYFIRNTNTNKMLDVSGNSTSNGANIHQWSFHGGQNQQWQINSCVSLPPTSTPTATSTSIPSATPTNTPSPTPTFTSTPIPTASGGGTIWLDKNDDGQYESNSEVGLANVQIEVYNSNQTPGQDTPLQTVTTDNNGNYQFANIPAGSYIFYIPNPPADVPMSSTTTDTQDNDEDNDDNGIQTNSGEPISSPAIYLYPGTEPDVNVDGDGPNSNLTIDFGLTGPGEVIGKAWSDIDRDGIQDGNEPGLGNAQVKLVEPNGNVVASTQSQNNGDYTLPNVPIGDYSVEVIPPGDGWWLTEKDQGGDDSLDSDIEPNSGYSDAFTLFATDSLVVDAGLVQMQIGGYAWDDVNSDGLQDETESGIEGLVIELINNGEWVFCADEHETCNFTGTATVRYGKNGVYAYKTATDGILCDNTVFGDPLYGIFKECSYQDTNIENATVIASTTTDNTGNYVLDSSDIEGGLLPSTSYILRTTLSQSNLGGRTPTKVNVDNGESNADAVDSDAIRVDGNAMIYFVTGAAEQENHTHDFGFGIFNASISGEAWNDLRGDGIQNPIIPNANGVPVRIYNSGGHLVAITETAGNGAYEFAKLPDDSYVVDFEPPVATVWFTLKDQGTDETLDSDVNPNSGRTDVIAIVDGSQASSVDAGLVRGTLAYPPRLPNPGDQLSKLDDPVAIYLTAIDDQGGTITYSASNLPPGLTIGTNNGRITGAPSAAGVYNVSITASDGEGGVTTITFVWAVEELPAITCASGAHEAEDGQLSGNFVRVVLPDGASKTQHIVVPDGMGSEFNGPNEHSAIYCFNVETSGRYRIVGTGRASSGNADSFFVTVDGSPSDGYLWDVQPSSEYGTDYVNHRGNADPVEVMLSAGQHLIAVYLREDGTQLDKIELELVEAVAETVTCGGMVQEAEDGVPSGNFLTYVDQSASNGIYVGVARNTGSNYYGAYVQDKIDYCFNVPADGAYILQGTVLSDYYLNNSFYVKVNGLPDRGYLWDTTISSTYVDDEMNNRYGSDPVILNLSAGENFISFYLREDDTRLDKVALIDASGVQAAGLSETQRAPEGAGEEVNVSGTLEVPADHVGEPELSGISVTLSGANYQAETVTNHVGKYYIDEVPAGEYTVTATVPDAEVEDGEKTLTQTITVNAAPTDETVEPDAEDDGRTVDSSFDYQPPAEEVDNGVYLPFMSIR